MTAQVTIRRNEDLVNLNTLRLRSRAEHFYHATDLEGLRGAVQYANESGFGLNILGGGSNIVLPEHLEGLTLLVDIRGISYADDIVTINAGEIWHNAVLDTVSRGFWGLENLALIPGRAGAAPIQNIGAYGQELASVFQSLDALDCDTGELRTFDRDACGFEYRGSIFRGSNQFIVTTLRLSLKTRFHPILDYPGVEAEIQKLGLVHPTPEQVSTVISQIRRNKLPDPGAHPNVGSFFKNPILPRDHYMRLRQDHDDLVGWEQPDGSIKISAAGLIERLGLKGERIGDVEVSMKHSLVLVNHGGATAGQVLALAGRIRDAVNSSFGVVLDIEPVVLPVR